MECLHGLQSAVKEDMYNTEHPIGVLVQHRLPARSARAMHTTLRKCPCSLKHAKVIFKFAGHWTGTFGHCSAMFSAARFWAMQSSTIECVHDAEYPKGVTELRRAPTAVADTWRHSKGVLTQESTFRHFGNRFALIAAARSPDPCGVPLSQLATSSNGVSMQCIPHKTTISTAPQLSGGTLRKTIKGCLRNAEHENRAPAM